MIERAKIEQGVVNMPKVNTGVTSDQKVLIVTDIPAIEEWTKKQARNSPKWLRGLSLPRW